MANIYIYGAENVYISNDGTARTATEKRLDSMEATQADQDAAITEIAEEVFNK